MRSEKQELVVCGLTVLAAIDRAARHRESPTAHRGEVARHLGLPAGAATTQKLKPAIQELLADGSIEPINAHGGRHWAITRRGRRRLARARRTRPIELPESPQHQTWRIAHTHALANLPRYLQHLREATTQAQTLLTDCEQPGAGGPRTWLTTGRSLHALCSEIACAQYTINHWCEPADEQADPGRHPPDAQLDAALGNWLRDVPRTPAEEAADGVDRPVDPR